MYHGRGGSGGAVFGYIGIWFSACTPAPTQPGEVPILAAYPDIAGAYR